MISKTVVISNAGGIHLRPAGVLCNKALKYKSKIHFRTEGVEANAKSVLSVLGACIKCGTEITFTCDGEDEEEAMAGIMEIIDNGFQEPGKESQ